jgi:hypothetical protein
VLSNEAGSAGDQHARTGEKIRVQRPLLLVPTAHAPGWR